MPLTTPFHPRVASANRVGLWKHWAGYLIPPQYQYSLTAEYYGIRNSVSLLDTTPLFKYRITGRDAARFLARVLARDIDGCPPGRAQYTCWCNEGGFVLQDGVILQVTEGEYWLTAADPTLRYFRVVARDMGAEVDIEDVSRAFGILALQGPHAYDVIRQLTDDVTSLTYFGATKTEIRGRSVIVSRTGYTGDLGYELWIHSEDACEIWDALMQAGQGHNIVPIGTTALKMARIEAGLLLMGADFHSARFAWVDAQCETPLELGWSWMFRTLEDDDRAFIGRAAIEAELRDKSSRWTTVGLAVDWHEYERVYSAAGVLPPRHEVYSESTMSIYRRGTKEWDYAGYASSFTSSSLLRTPLAIAKLPLDLAKPGTEVDLEVTVIRRPENVLARVERMPFFNPTRKTAAMDEGAAV
ncbi:MAG: aminomethyltransferase family protein [Gemmatimonadota bacterium]|nr:aminomethyltransferase family protein [Gemmatimonadota bacterium]MDE3012653.1 aminomethyltransferase family protein [Gemmatimonadota bacterium]